MSVGDVPTPSADPLIDKVVADRYKILRKLGEGGMGAVYLAEHVVIEKKLALKVLAPDLARRAELVARFLQEARSASRIGHENVIDISDFGQSADGLVYIAMEFLDGRDLGQIVRSQGAMEWGEARDIVLQICRALRAAHDKGIVHRDMKPENIFLIQREGQPHFVKILDFGIAKVMGLDPNGPRLTRTGMIFGTPEYMAPEQAEGKDTDHRADIYAVGCILYHLITGQTPFVADSFMTMLTKHLMEDPVPPSVRRPDLSIPPEMDALVLKALEKDRDRRWQSMAALLEAVSTCPGPSAKQPLPGRTLAMGGAAAAAVHVARGPRVAQALPELDLSDTPERPLPRPAGKKTAALVGAGAVLGLAVAGWLMLAPNNSAKPASQGRETAVAPAPAQAAPAPPAAPAAALPVPSPSPAAVAAEERPAAVAATETGHKQHGRGHKQKSAATAATMQPEAPTASPTSASKPELPATPRELKPFPNL